MIRNDRSPEDAGSGIIVIVAYRPKVGMAERLAALVEDHVPRLRTLGLATDLPPTACRAADGTVVEVFEWVSEEAIQNAHTKPEVLEMWREFGEACDIVPLTSLAETSQIFASFAPLR